jgi:hypothetical protein
MVESKEPKLKRLKTYLRKLQKWYHWGFELVPADVDPRPEIPTANPEEEQIARIADSLGFDGSLYCREIRDRHPLSLQSIRRLKKQIKTIPRIISRKRRQTVRGAISAIIQNFCSKLSGRTVERRMGDLGPRHIRKGLIHKLRLKSR